MVRLPGSEIQKMTRGLAELPVSFEPNNPVTSLMTDVEKGVLREEILNEKILSAIVELQTTLDQIPRILGRIEEVARCFIPRRI